MLPMARQSPMALSMLSAAAQQFGRPVSFGVGASAGSMFGGLSKWAQQQGLVAAGSTRCRPGGRRAWRTSAGRQPVRPADRSGIGGALAQGIATHGATLQDAFMNSVGGRGGFSGQALGKYFQFLAGSGCRLRAPRTWCGTPRSCPGRRRSRSPP